MPLPLSVRRSFIGIKVISGRERVKRSVYVPLVAARREKIMRRRVKQTVKWARILKVGGIKFTGTEARKSLRDARSVLNYR